MQTQQLYQKNAFKGILLLLQARKFNTYTKKIKFKSHGVISRIYDSLYSCQFDKNTGLWDFVPKFKFETKNNLVFINILETSSGGNPAPLDYYAIILPKNKKDTIFEKELFINCERDYLIYGDWDNDNIHILNLESKNGQNIILTPKLALSRSPTMSIQETKIKNSIFYIKYETLDKNDNLKIVEKTFKLEI